MLAVFACHPLSPPDFVKNAIVGYGLLLTETAQENIIFLLGAHLFVWSTQNKTPDRGRGSGRNREISEGSPHLLGEEQ